MLHVPPLATYTTPSPARQPLKLSSFPVLPAQLSSESFPPLESSDPSLPRWPRYQSTPKLTSILSSILFKLSLSRLESKRSRSDRSMGIRRSFERNVRREILGWHELEGLVVSYTLACRTLSCIFPQTRLTSLFASQIRWGSRMSSLEWCNWK